MKENKNEGRDRSNAGLNYQDGGHHEGQMNNTVPASGQPSPHNTSSGISEMGGKGDHRQSGKDQRGQEESWEQQDKP
ncbi:hypothetical protein V9K67_24080 [Paraflavisolibacter sp. H34]|uniref:hypothetical protein n=1 Tax=Huijunlia imazamoxiresistens TaxID=3127457 RepID=UPI00301A0FCD